MLVCASGAVLAGTAPPLKAAQQLPAIARDATLRFRDGDFAAAEALRRKALAIAIAADGSDSPIAATAMIALAQLDIARLRYLDAEPLLIAARSVLMSQTSRAPAELTQVLVDLGRIALARGQDAAADQWAVAALACSHGTSQQNAAIRLQGAVLTAQHRFDEALPVLNDAVSQAVSTGGDDGPDTARALSQLGNLYLRAEEFADALPVLELTAALDQDNFGPAHPFVADDLFDVGLAYEGLKRTADAERVFATALNMLQRGSERDTPRVAYVELELTRLLRDKGETTAADAAYKDARRILHAAEAAERKRERTA